MKEIKEFFKSEPPKPPFGKDENGRDIYYLWGRPGEAFYVNKSKKRLLTVMFYSIISICMSSLLVAIFLEITNIISQTSFYYINSLIFTLLPVVYIIFMCIGKRYMSLHNLPIKKRSPQKRMIFLWIGLVSTQLFILAPILLPELGKDLDFLMALSMLYLIFITLFFIRLHRTKGHYFSG